jgi:hypothetical protein
MPDLQVLQDSLRSVRLTWQGFVSAITNLRDFTPAVYDITIAISTEAPEPSMSSLLKGQPSVVRF